jgi:hypothetical protein
MNKNQKGTTPKAIFTRHQTVRQRCHFGIGGASIRWIFTTAVPWLFE